jgi:hypothetical protein
VIYLPEISKLHPEHHSFRLYNEHVEHLFIDLHFSGTIDGVDRVIGWMNERYNAIIEALDVNG